MRVLMAVVCAGAIGASAVIGLGAQNAPPQTKKVQVPARNPEMPTQATMTAVAPDFNGIVKRYCAGCHNDTPRNTTGLTLANFDVAKVAQHAEVGERMIRKLRAGMMPPPGSPRADVAMQLALFSPIE